MAFDNLMVFTGNANPRLAQSVAKQLNIQLGRSTVSKFSDGEVMVELLENVRGKDVFVLQSTCAPTNDHLMELMIMVDALRRSSAARITAAIPYFGYARQDRRPRSARVAITAKVVANMLTVAGVNRLLTLDLHADQIQGFFDIPVDNVYATPILLGDLFKMGYKNQVVVSPDVGGVVRASDRQEARERPRDHRQAPAAPERRHGDEHHRRRERQDVRDHGRHGRHGEHALRSGACVEGAGRGAGRGVLHAPGVVRARGEPHRAVGDRRAGGDRHHSAEAGGRGVPEDSRRERRGADGRDDETDLRGELGELPVR
jgi:ribose-phosphate pyrophosphokinase